MPLISVIVPVYKVENVVDYCINSIINQTFKDFELILVDDGSPDNSGNICDDYALKDSRITVIHKDNEGVSVARNIGIELAKGKYICFIDSDDYIQNDYLEKLINAKKRYKNYDNIWCGFITNDNYNSTKNPLQTVIYETKAQESFSNVKSIMTLHEKWLDAGPVCKLFEREIIKENQIQFPVDLSLGEDLIFNFRYLDCTNGNIYILNKSLYTYVIQNDDSLGHKYYSNLFDIYKEINKIMLYYIKKWKCDDIQIGKYYSSCFYKYEVVLKNTYHNNCKLSKSQKLRYNNEILKSYEFVKSVELSSCFIHPLYRLAYKSKNYIFVRILDKIFS